MHALAAVPDGARACLLMPEPYAHTHTLAGCACRRGMGSRDKGGFLVKPAGLMGVARRRAPAAGQEMERKGRTRWWSTSDSAWQGSRATRWPWREPASAPRCLRPRTRRELRSRGPTWAATETEKEGRGRRTMKASTRMACNHHLRLPRLFRPLRASRTRFVRQSPDSLVLSHFLLLLPPPPSSPSTSS